MSNIRKVAIADDHSLVRKGLVALVNSFPGYEVLFDVPDGVAFKHVVEQGSVPSIALIDINMPNMNGYETAEWIRLNHPEIKILALSTMESEQAIIRMIRHGAKGYLVKDAEPSELKQAMDEVFSLGFYYNDIVSKKILRGIHELTDVNSGINTLIGLNERETTFLRLACSEKSYHEIASEMCVSTRTIDGYRDALFKKLNITSRVGLVLYAIRNNIVEVT